MRRFYIEKESGERFSGIRIAEPYLSRDYHYRKAMDLALIGRLPLAYEHLETSAIKGLHSGSKLKREEIKEVISAGLNGPCNLSDKFVFSLKVIPILLHNLLD